jgi:hypothetical protein
MQKLSNCRRNTLTWIWYENCDQMWDTTPKYIGLLGSQDRGETPYTNTETDLDQYKTLDLNQETPTSPMYKKMLK